MSGAKVIVIDGHRRRLVARNRLAAEHAYLVPMIAKHIGATLPACFDLSDLIDAGTQGLMKARDRWDPEHASGAPFAHFSKHYIRGAILDSVRRKHWLEATHPPLEFRGPDSANASGADQIAEPSTLPDPLGELALRRMVARLHKELRWIGEPGQSIVRMYYLEERRLPQIAEELGLPESRVPLLRDQAIGELKRRLAWHGLREAA